MVRWNDRLDHSTAPVTLLVPAVATLNRVPSPEAVAAAVAHNTRRLRTARGWSLDQLATRSGVSKGMLVHLEQARTNPSLGTLCKVSETLGVSLAGLVELHEAPVVRVVAADGVIRLWESDAGSWGDLLVGTDEREHLELWRWNLAPGDDHGSDAHAPGTREMVHVISGTLTLDVGDASHTVPAGGAALFHADRDHRYRNTGRKRVSLVMVVLQRDADLDEWTQAGGRSDGGGGTGDGGPGEDGPGPPGGPGSPGEAQDGPAGSTP
jgi:transcriptional regulator with XRE-family HTH domain